MRISTGLFFCAAAAVYALRLDPVSLGVSKRIPTVGDRIVWQVPIVNDGEESRETRVTVVLRVSRRDLPLEEVARVSRDLRLDPGAALDIPLGWSPQSTGYHTLVFELEGLDQRLTQRVPVVNRDLYFVWFGSPREFRWCNVPTTVKDEDRDWWLRRGAIPAAWKGGVCYKDWPLERFVQSWGAVDWIAIDEVGGPGDVTDTFIAAWRQLAESKPDQFVAVWFMGAHAYWSDIRHLIDLFVPEIYLNYRGNHLGQFDSYFRTARAAGVMDQVIPGLGINQIMSKDKTHVRVSPDRRDVLRQFRYIKRTAPELNGIGFFTSYSCAWGVAEYADALCEEYFIKPVLTLKHPGNAIEVSAGARPGTHRVAVEIANVGAMDAYGVSLEWRWGWPDSGHFRRVAVGDIAGGETRPLAITLPASPGWRPVEARIVASSEWTLLDATARTQTVAFDDPAAERLPVFMSSLSGLPGVRLKMVDLDERFAGPLTGVRLGRGLEVLGTVPCALLPSRPGREERQAVVMLDDSSAEDALVALRPGEPAPAPAPAHFRDGNRLTVRNAYYTAELDVGTDVLIRLSPSGGMDNLLARGWRFSAPGYEGIGEARIATLPGVLVVTIPFDSEQASGASQYVFFAASPAIRVARLWAPRGAVTVGRAGGRADLFQKGGTFALQAGVGAAVTRGRLHDSSAYRDLLFGYRGGGPRPENADRAGWLDMSYGAADAAGGLGVVIEERWRDAAMKSYDVTRLYDGSDWVEVLHVWGRETTLERPQRSCIYLIPHGPLDFTDPACVPPARVLWRELHRQKLAWCPLDAE